MAIVALVVGAVEDEVKRKVRGDSVISVVVEVTEEAEDVAPMLGVTPVAV